MAKKARRLWMLGAGLVALAALALLASACGGASGMFDMDEMHRQMHGIGSQAPQTPVVADATRVTVEIRNYDFFPRELTVTAGTAVTWTNRDSVPHDATAESDGWGTGILDQGESGTITFDSSGTYSYVCTIHPNMKATLTVVEEAL